MKNFHVLQRYIPGGASQEVEKLLTIYPVNIRITKSRMSKLGDFRPQPENIYHLITINYDLNPYAFLITLIHELAHLAVWNSFQNRVESHGREWKYHFQELMIPFFEKNVFPEEISKALKNYISNPSASSCSDPQLSRALQFHNTGSHLVLFLDDLPENACFTLKDQPRFIFRKGKKARTRYKCFDLNSKREYWVTGHAEVVLVEEN